MNAGEFAKRLAIIRHQTGRSRDFRRKAIKSLARQAGAITIIMNGHETGWRLPNGQIVCKKRRYPNEDAAAAALAAIQANPLTPKMPERLYLCPYCKGWHLTSQLRIEEAIETIN